MCDLDDHMERFYVFILRNDVWIYIICALGLFWYISELLRARRLLRRAMFGLEQERGRQMRNTAVLFILIFGALSGFVYYVNAQIAPQLPAEILRPPTPTPDIFRTPLASPTPLTTRVPSPTPPLVPTITLAAQPGEAPPAPPGDAPPAAAGTPEALETPTPGPTPTPAIGCTLDLRIDEPRDGSTVSGSITFIGTADTANFGGYQMEINGPQTDGQWSSLLGRTITQPVRETILGSANLGEWQSGPYLIRLVAVDAEQNPIAICVTQVTLNNQ